MSKPAGVPAPNPAAPKSPSITCTWRVGDAAIVRPRVTLADRRTPDRSVLRGQGKALGDGGDEGRAHRPRGGRSLTGGQRSHGPDTLLEVRPTRLPCSGRGADERPDDSGQPRALLARPPGTEPQRQMASAAEIPEVPPTYTGRRKSPDPGLSLTNSLLSRTKHSLLGNIVLHNTISKAARGV